MGAKIMIKNIVILSILFIQGGLLFATQQIQDTLVYSGKEYSIAVEPMEGYFNKFPEKRPQVNSSMLWRGYAAKFEIIQNELWVVDILTMRSNMVGRDLVFSFTSIIEEVLDGKNRMKLEWYSGALTFRQGDHFVLLNIQNGSVISESNLDLDQFISFKTKQFEQYRQTEEYRNLKERHKSDTLTDEQIDNIILMVVLDTLDIMIDDF